MKKSFFKILVFLLFELVSISSYAQCNTIINTFPYQENFETNNGQWVMNGGTWEWGTPTKRIINKAGSGNKCWVVGGLNIGQLYGASENSVLQSPCFDFSNLQNPYISFKVIWEVEWIWDAVTFEYSDNGGNSWNILGTNNDNANCLNANWYNATGAKKGWSGNVQPSATSGSFNCLGGNGSGNWVIAKHVMAMLAGKQQVMFRFRFSGSPICREYYEGFGIDDIVIKEMPILGADFSYNCEANNKVNFINNSGGCPTSFLWNFGDIASGINNTSTDANPIHVFSSPNNYTITLTSFYAGAPLSVISKNITVVNVMPVVVSNIKCNGDATGKLSVTVLPVSNQYNYSWNTNPVQTTSSIEFLKAGNYTITVNGTNVCTTSQTIQLTQPDSLLITPIVGNAKCGKNSGMIDANAKGGTTPYQYQWSTVANTQVATALWPNNYFLNVTDHNNCSASATNLLVKNIENNIAVFLGNDTVICPGDKLILDAGSFASYKWQNNATTSTFTVTKTGRYNVVVVDADGCTATDEIDVTVDCTDVFFPSAFTPNGDGKNENFGPLGNIAALKNYTLKVFNRFGQIVFESNNPFKKWDGKFKGIGQTETFVWMANYSINGGINYSKKGTIIIMH
jgi:gliding motility-associated-like protein